MSQTTSHHENTALFRQAWTIYDALSEKNYMFHREIYAAVAELLRERHEGGAYRILDLGSGNARFLAPGLNAAPPEYYEGVDLSQPALEEAREHLRALPRTAFVHGEMLAALQAGNAPFDIIFSGFALHHLTAAAKQQFFRECARRLNPGGAFIMVDIVCEEGQSRDECIRDYLHYMRTKWTEVIPQQLEAACAHVAAYDFPETGSDLARMASDAGLSKSRVLNRFAQHYTIIFSA